MQEQARQFLARPVPKDVHYTPNSISEGFIKRYSENGSTHLSEEQQELLAISIYETEKSSRTGSQEKQAYFRESLTLLKAIQQEQEAGNDPSSKGE